MRQQLFGLPIDTLSTEATLARIEELIGEGGVHQHVVLNASKVVQAQTDEALRRAIVQCDIVNADGMSVVWAARLLGISVPERVAGIDLMDALLARAAARGWPVYFLGARQDIVERVVVVESMRYPGLMISGYRNGYWSSDEEDLVVSDVARARPSLLFVAMPSPKKEEFLARHRDVLSVPFVMGVGGSFDVVAGLTKRAPRWMQQAGLEWAFRLKQEPRRMARRYIVGNSKFVALVVRNWVSTRKKAH